MTGDGIRCGGLTTGYRIRTRKRAVLRDVDLIAPEGTVTALIGPNGAGKTTLIRALLGLVRPWSGEVRVRGLPPDRYRREHGLGYLPEEACLPPGWSVAELLGEGARLSGLPRGTRRRTVWDALEEEGLAGIGRERVDRLSKGTARRVSLVFALLGAPVVVVLDEPWSGLDPPARIRLREKVAHGRDRGCAVVVASHELGEVARVADRCVALDGGTVRGRLERAGVEEMEALFTAAPASP